MWTFFVYILGEIEFRVYSLFSSDDSKVITLVMGVLMAGVNFPNESAMDGISRSICCIISILFTEGVVAERRGL